MIGSRKGKKLLLLTLLALPYQLHAAAPPAQYDIDIKELDRPKPTQAPAPKAEKKRVEKKPSGKGKHHAPAAAQHLPKGEEAAGNEGYARYTVKAGDHIFKILMSHFGLSNEAAEKLIPEIVKVNNIENIKALQAGQTLLIPVEAKQERPAKAAKKGKRRPKKEEGRKAAPETAAAPRAPEPAPAAPPPSPAPEAPKAPSETPAPPATAVPVPAPQAPAPPVPPVATPEAVAPSTPEEVTWICSVPQADAAKTVDTILNAVSVSWTKNRIIHSGEGAPTAFSIRVDRYFEYKGNRCIVSIGENDPYNYTLIRLLETSGYKVLRLSGKEEFKTVVEKLFAMMGVVPQDGTHPLPGWRQGDGYLIRQEDAGGRRVLITDQVPGHGLRWVMPPGCVVK